MIEKALQGDSLALGRLARSVDDLDAGAARIISDLFPMGGDRKSTRLNSSHIPLSRMPSSA